MQPYEFTQKTDLRRALSVEALRGVMFTADSGANRFTAEVTSGGETVDLSGATCTGYAVRDDGSTVIVTGAVTGNRASVVLTQSAYVIPGPIDIVIKVAGGGATMAVGAWRAYVQRSTTDAIVDPGHVIPSIEELLAKIADCETATENATAAATSATGAASNANSAADTARNAALKLESMDAIADTLETGQSATVSVATVGGHYRLMLGLPKGDTGAAAAITSQTTRYKVSESGEVAPSGSWQNDMPTVPQGQYLWIRRGIIWNDGTTTALIYPVRQGMHGLGSVSSVTNTSPDANGNVTLSIPEVTEITSAEIDTITEGGGS